MHGLVSTNRETLLFAASNACVCELALQLKIVREKCLPRVAGSTIRCVDVLRRLDVNLALIHEVIN